MRDGSIDDIVGTWIDRMVQEHWGRNPGDNEAAVYFALLKRASIGLRETHDRFKPVSDFDGLITGLLETVREGLAQPKAAAIAVDEWPEPDFAEIEEPAVDAPTIPEDQSADYWSADTWKKDFYTTFSRWFWDMKDYAIPAGRRKSDFLWDVGEVWVAAGASALVYYAKDDRERWFQTAQMLRHYADLTEEDGLRALPWGRWGRYAKKNHRPKPSA
jgi:hypothetical protein